MNGIRFFFLLLPDQVDQLDAVLDTELLVDVVNMIADRAARNE